MLKALKINLFLRSFSSDSIPLPLRKLRQKSASNKLKEIMNVGECGCYFAEEKSRGFRTIHAPCSIWFWNFSHTQPTRPMIDVRRVRAVGGKGGDGCVSFLRLWANDTAGPDGGDGGSGGHVILKASSNVNSLEKLDAIIKGPDGEKGFNKNCNGKNADHTIISVPVGTVIKSSAGVIGDLDKEGCMFILARGGAGGRGNSFFKSDVRQSPKIAEVGAKGEDLTYTLELKSMANFGLVGFPNAGKSTLLQAMSRARSKVAPYPFTTLQPYIGVVAYTDYEQVTIADLPGLVEDSHKGKGLGIQFLRHAERCACLAIVVDVTNEPLTAFYALQKELTLFSEKLAKKEQIVIANKMDLPGSEENLKLLKAEIGEEQVISVSAKFGTNIMELLKKLRAIYDRKNKMFCEDTQ